MLYGRERERSRIGELLDGARKSRSAALVISGEAGVGKSALLEDACQQASDMRVLRGSGVESEANLPFATLHQVVRPVLGLLDRLPEPQAEALRGALGLAAAGGDDRFLVSLAALSLLSEAAEEEPLLCLVDDAHWLDDASADALVFVARRLRAEGVVMLFACREGGSRRFEPRGLPELRLAGLDAAAAGALIDQQAGVRLSPEIRERLIADTAGNPLALIELSSTLSPGQLSGAEPVLGPIPVSTRVERAFLERVRRLPVPTQTLLLVAAADESGDLATVLRAAAELGAGGEALDAAEQSGLVQIRGGKVELRHPLVRSAVYQGAPLSMRRTAHAALASVLRGAVDADRRAWHRAAASIVPDASVVEELERAAERARRRSAFAAASLAFERTAALTEDDHERAQRLIAAGEDAWQGGHIQRSRMLLQRARPLTADPIERADIARFLGLIEMTDGVPADACHDLITAAREVAPLDGERALQLLSIASVSAIYGGKRELATEVAALARDLPLRDTPLARLLVEFLLGLDAHCRGDFRVAAMRFRVALAQRIDHEDEALAANPAWLLFAGRAAIYLGDDEAIVRAVRSAAARARAGGLLGVLSHILPRLAYADLWAGRWASALAHTREGLELGHEHQQQYLIADQLGVLALVLAHRGEEEECRSRAAEAREVASAHRFAPPMEFTDWALTLLELGLGRAQEAFRRARQITATLLSLLAALDRIEAAIRAGERESAREWLASFEPWAESLEVPWARAIALHCGALLADDDADAECRFRQALAIHADSTRPFERARTELAFGEFLRRSRRRVEARQHLRAALDQFESLGATLWAERARVELRASGQTARKRDPSARADLTAQELQIARFVADGLSNRDVAARLFLSPRTIDFHLRNIFRKLEISSRVELARLELGDEALNTLVASDSPTSPAKASALTS
jgi:DNA-binding CsgD family transcriptional regulator